MKFFIKTAAAQSLPAELRLRLPFFSLPLLLSLSAGIHAAISAESDLPEPSKQGLIALELPSPGQSEKAETPAAATIFTGILLPEELVGPENLAEDPSEDMDDLVRAVKNDQQNYRQALENQTSFSGLYAYGRQEQYGFEGESNTVVGLEWSLFKEGWREGVRELDKKKLESKLRHLQSLKELKQQQLESQQHRIKSVSNLARWLISSKRLRYLELLRNNRARQVEAGSITVDDCQEIEFKLETENLLNKQLAKQPFSKLKRSLWELLNRIEGLAPKNTQTLIENAWKKSVDIDMQDKLVERSKFLRSLSDDLSFSVYAEHRDERGADNNQDNVLGVRWRLPIETNQGRDELMRLEEEACRTQGRLARVRAAERVSSLAQDICLQIERLRSRILEHHLLARYIDNSRVRGQYSLPSLPYTPARQIEELSQQLLDKEADIVDARISLLELLTQLNSLAGQEKLADLLTEAK